MPRRARPRPGGPLTVAAALGLALAAACEEGPVADDPALRPATGACEANDDDAAPSDPFVDCVDEFSPAGDASFGHDELLARLAGPPRGAGLQGGLDVVSLGCGGEITLYFDAPAIVDGPGPDLIVFENPFALGDDATFVEPARVLVSDDGERWREFPCDLSARPPLGCAGIGLVFADPESAPELDPRDPASAGGDAFDLADVGLTRARYVRLVDRTAEYYGERTWCAGATGGFDLDAIAAIHDP
ncbi:MAG: cell surface protein [Myxococcales bacterium]|nr:cell surface protein [Myxococcales bacterium]MCB9705278.1 cell surface protein [Myxococcales bacterium]